MKKREAKETFLLKGSPFVIFMIKNTKNVCIGSRITEEKRKDVP